MTSLLRSLRRIALGVAVSVAGLASVVTLLVRQPSLHSKQYRFAIRSSSTRIKEHVRFLTTEVRPRSADRPENLNCAAAYIRSAFSNAGGRVAEETFTARGRVYRNVIAEFGPTAGGKTIVGAHYDAFASTGDLPGADDNASGTAGLLELARMLGSEPPIRNVQLVAFSTEEPPFFGSEDMGSAVHASRLRRDGTEVDGMICLEMIGYFRGEQSFPSPLLAAIYPNRGEFIAVSGGWNDRHLTRAVKAAIRGAGGVEVYSFTAPHQMMDASDQRNFWSRHWPAVMVTDTAYLRNPNYHTKRDTADILDFERMARVIDGVFSAVQNQRF